eukprot:3475723-Rhodomonas_salina.2
MRSTSQYQPPHLVQPFCAAGTVVLVQPFCCWYCGLYCRALREVLPVMLAVVCSAGFCTAGTDVSVLRQPLARKVKSTCGKSSRHAQLQATPLSTPCVNLSPHPPPRFAAQYE